MNLYNFRLMCIKTCSTDIAQNRILSTCYFCIPKLCVLLSRVRCKIVQLSGLQENEFDEVVGLLNLLEIRSDTWQRALYESSSSPPPPAGQPPSATSSDVSTRTDPENLSPASRFEAHPKKRRRRSSVPVNLSIDTKHDEDTAVTQSNWRVSKVRGK